MLSCRELVDETTADPELIGSGQKLRWSIRLHLMMCRHCRRYTRQLKQLLALLARLPHRQPQVTPETVDRIYKNIEVQEYKHDS